MTTLDVRAEIRGILLQHPEVKDRDVAEAVGLSPQSYYYLMNKAARFDEGMYRKIKEFLLNQGITKNSTNETEMIGTHFIEFTSISSQLISRLSTDVHLSIKDKKITEDERQSVLRRIEDMRENIIKELDEFEKVVRG